MYNKSDDKRLQFETYSATGLVAVGCFLLIASLYMPPIGVINQSVLEAFGEIALFAGTLFGINLHYGSKIFHRNKTKNEDKQ